MKLVQPLLRHGALSTALVFFVACSGTPTGENPANDPSTGDPVANASAAPEAGTPEAGAIDEATGQPVAAANASAKQGDQGGQGQGMREERMRFLIEKSLEDARRSLENRLFEDALSISTEVLMLDPSNEEAARIQQTAQSQIGTGSGALGQGMARAQQYEVQKSREQYRISRELAAGDTLMQNLRFGDAIEAYRRAQIIQESSVFYEPESMRAAEIKAKLEAAQQAKAEADKTESDRQRAATQAQLRDDERQKSIQRASQVRRLVDEANYHFQVGKYSDAVRKLDAAIALEPTNEDARSLLELARRAEHSENVETIRLDWRQQWDETFHDLATLDVPQTEAIKYDLQRWAEVRQRGPREFTPEEALASPAEQAILAKLRSTIVEHNFAEASLQDWAEHYGRVAEVNFIVSSEASELDPDVTSLNDFVLPRMPVSQALDVIGSKTGVKWRVRNGFVELVTPENAGGRMYLQYYPVQDLVNGIRNKPGVELKLKSSGDEEAFGADGDEEVPPTVVDEGRLGELLGQSITPEGAFEAEGAGMSITRGVVAIVQSRDVHEQVAKLLSDLRQSVGLQVDVEARFLSVEDSFLEDVGVDFRGLGNQASEGVAGRGLERNNRGGAGFDDFGRREVINPATPGEIGTGSDPGFFFDDGLDGDIMGRTENLYDRALGSDELRGSGGLSLQYAFLDDAELEVVLRAVEKQERSEIINAPRLLVFNNARANMSVLRQTSYIRDFDVEIAQAAAVANPIVDVVSDGVVLDVRPVISSDRRFVTMELRPTVLTLQEPIPTLTTTLGVGQPVQIQLPEVTLQRVRTTVTIPDGGTLMLGGMKMAQKQKLRSSVPILGDLPGFSFLFSRNGTFIQNRKVVILIKATIVIPSEFEPDMDK